MATFLGNEPEAIQQCVITNEPFVARNAGKRVRVIPISQSGYDAYPVIFTRREFLRKNPDIVQRFVDASVRGWRDYLECDPSKVHSAILAKNPQTSLALLRYSRSMLIDHRLIRGDAREGEDIGRLSVDRLRREADILFQLGILARPVAVTEYVTTRFLEHRNK